MASCCGFVGIYLTQVAFEFVMRCCVTRVELAVRCVVAPVASGLDRLRKVAQIVADL